MRKSLLEPDFLTSEIVLSGISRSFPTEPSREPVDTVESSGPGSSYRIVRDQVSVTLVKADNPAERIQPLPDKKGALVLPPR